MSYGLKGALIDFILLFFIGLVILYAIRDIESYAVSAALLAIMVVIFIQVYQSESKNVLTISKKGFVRYTLLCSACNWEWMSNATDKKYNKKCPNCGETSKIELIGIRRVHKLPKRSNKDLTSYFRK